MQSMYLSKKILWPLLSLIASSLSADTVVWMGGFAGNDMDTSTNWSPSTVPGPLDSAAFTGNGTFPLPNLSNNESFTLDSVIFSDDSHYTLQGTGAQFSLYGEGVTNNSSLSQTFELTDGAYILFFNSAIASQGSHPINYSLDDSHIIFSDSSHGGNAQITVSHSGSSFNFFGNSTAGNAIIAAENQAFGAFNGSATASNSQISLHTNTGMNFYDHSTAEKAIFTIDTGSALRFLNSTTAENAQLTVKDAASLLQFFNQSRANSAFIQVSSGGSAVFYNQAQADNATFAVTDPGSTLTFMDNSSGNNAVITGMNGGGVIFANSDSNQTSISLFSNSFLECDSNVAIGSLAGDSTSSLILNQSDVRIGNNHASTTFEGEIINTGGVVSITKIGKGTWVLTGDNASYTDQVFIESGELNLNGALGGQVTISGGLLTGTGIIGSNLNVASGIVAPGNSIGTLSISGNYNPSSLAIYEVQINGSGESSLLDITGIASLNGFIEVASVDNTYRIGNNYTILQAGSITNHFIEIIHSNPSLNYFLSYDDTHAYLRLQTNFTDRSQSPNERNVGMQIDNTTTPSGELANVINMLLTLPENQLLNALELMSGAQYAALIQNNLYATKRFVRSLYNAVSDRLDPCYCGIRCSNYEIWSQFSEGQARLAGNHPSGFDNNHYNISLGIQTTLHPSLTLGVAANYAMDHLKFNLGGHATCWKTQAALYGTYRAYDYYILTEFIGGNCWSQMKRPVKINTLSYSAKSRPNIWNGTFYNEIGIDYNFCDLAIQPFFAVEVGFSHRSQAKEHGAGVLNLSALKKSVPNLNTSIGLHFTKNLNNIRIRGDIAWQYDCNSLNSQAKNQFLTFGESFNVKGHHLNRNGIWGALNLAKYVSSHCNLYFELSGEANGSWNACGINCGLNADF